ncbi:hypothetical protein F4778DRAFT_9999 [Xylariomycetidae sp. FL2044]|nr:hypothetical protein F4778DRAFT_9999 [Xylariomycetidae sp. FL2044]
MKDTGWRLTLFFPLFESAVSSCLYADVSVSTPVCLSTEVLVPKPTSPSEGAPDRHNPRIELTYTENWLPLRSFLSKSSLSPPCPALPITPWGDGWCTHAPYRIPPANINIPTGVSSAVSIPVRISNAAHSAGSSHFTTTEFYYSSLPL